MISNVSAAARRAALSLALVPVVLAAPAYAEEFTFNAVSEAGQAVHGSFQFDPSNVHLVSTDTQPDGTLHATVKAISMLPEPGEDDYPPIMNGWTVSEQGGLTLHELTDAGPPMGAMDVLVNRYKGLDGSSWMSLVLDSYGGLGHYGTHSQLTLNYRCDCGALFDQPVTAGLLVGHTPVSGQAFYGQYYYDAWGESGSWSKEQRIAFAVPEPQAWLSALSGLALIGLVALRGSRRGAGA